MDDLAGTVAQSHVTKTQRNLQGILYCTPLSKRFNVITQRPGIFYHINQTITLTTILLLLNFSKWSHS